MSGIYKNRYILMFSVILFIFIIYIFNHKVRQEELFPSFISISYSTNLRSKEHLRALMIQFFLMKFQLQQEQQQRKQKHADSLEQQKIAEIGEIWNTSL